MQTKTTLHPIVYLDTDAIARTVQEIHEREPKYVPSVDKDLPRMETELRNLQERAGHHERNAGEWASALAETKQKLADTKAAIDQLKAVLKPGVSVSGVNARIEELWKQSEKLEDKIQLCERQIERNDNIAKSTRKIIAEWPHHTLKELKALEKALKAAKV